jgi:hypothetical protein
MCKFAFVVAGVVTLMLVGFAGWNAEATILIVHPEPNYSLAQNAGCWLPGLPSECELGQQKVCDRFHNTHCKCTPCAGWYPWRQSKPAH